MENLKKRKADYEEKGRELLKTMRETAKLPVITKPAAAKELLSGKDTDMYTLAYPQKLQRLCGTDFTTSPYIEKQRAETR